MHMDADGVAGAKARHVAKRLQRRHRAHGQAGVHARRERRRHVPPLGAANDLPDVTAARTWWQARARRGIRETRHRLRNDANGGRLR